MEDLTQVREILTVNAADDELALSHVLHLLATVKRPGGWVHALVWDPKAAAMREIERWQRA